MTVIEKEKAIAALGERPRVWDENDYTLGARNEYDRIRLALETVPPAQPEIIRCKDCKWWDKSEGSQFGYCMAMKHGYMSANWEISIHRLYKGNFYCADAERSEE